MLFLSLVELVGWDQSIINKFTHTKKQNLGPELPIMVIAFDGISDASDDEQATVSQNLMRSTHPLGHMQMMTDKV